MTTLLVLIAFVNIGLLVALLMRYQPMNGLPQKAVTGDDGLQAAWLATPYAPPVTATPTQAPAAAPAFSAPPQPLSRVEDIRPLMEEAARQLDRRMDRLETLIAQADAAALRLERQRVQAQPTRPPVGDSFAAPTATPPPPPFQATQPAQPRHAKVRFLSNNLVQNVITLADAGYDALSIARELGRGVDEVTLALNLRRVAG